MNKYLARPFFLFRRKIAIKRYLDDCAREGRKTKLHVGCGNRPLGDGWLNVDVARIGDTVHYVDATRPMPFPDQSFDFVFSEHFLEHLSFEQGKFFLQEAFRVLKPGGRIRTATPDLQAMARVLLEKNDENSNYVKWVCENFLPERPAIPATAVNLLFYGWGHSHIYDAETLISIKQKMGFKEFAIHKSGESACAELRGLEQHGKSVPPEINLLETVVVEGVK